MHVPFECPGMTPFGLVAESNPRVLACVGHPSRLSDPSFFLSICLAHFRRSTMARPYLCLAFSHSGARKRHGKKRMSIFALFFWAATKKKKKCSPAATVDGRLRVCQYGIIPLDPCPLI
ncbi:hypothetical protein BJX68DRAFT_53197 [Aspergillus pseudodeflectus]|uniref:Uncharacterized protein n=1 Tax=Aspergillus pseudodeflectus TaxID=176178 RepID=A0ABR4J6X4_9EURO